MSKRKSGVSKREKLFCINYANCMDAEQAAISAGYRKNPLQKGQGLLCRSDIADEIARICEVHEQVQSYAQALGYSRLAFGDIADTVALLYMDKPTKEQLQDMDLFMVSEIKKLKDGAMEIKFFDRLKALEKLTQSSRDRHSPGGLLDALREGAQNLSHTAGDAGEV